MGNITEIDIEIGLGNVFDDEDVYYDCLKVFHEMILIECDKMTEALADGDSKTFIISIHGMKSVLSTIGAITLFESALLLESKAKDDNLNDCKEYFPNFKDQLLHLYEKLSIVL